jgi:hypothetical protein
MNVLANADPIGTQDWDGLFRVAVRIEFERAGDRVGDDCGGFRSWIDEGMLDVAAMLLRRRWVNQSSRNWGNKPRKPK